MRNNYYLSLINFKVKTSSLETFFKNEHGIGCSIFWDVVNMVLRGVLERHIGCCNHGATWGIYSTDEPFQKFPLRAEHTNNKSNRYVLSWKLFNLKMILRFLWENLLVQL